MNKVCTNFTSFVTSERRAIKAVIDKKESILCDILILEQRDKSGLTYLEIIESLANQGLLSVNGGNTVATETKAFWNDHFL